MGWGLAGAVGLQADKLRWLPGQKKFRYDIAGFITMMRVSSITILFKFYAHFCSIAHALVVMLI